jgi:hypothetical protein
VAILPKRGQNSAATQRHRSQGQQSSRSIPSLLPVLEVTLSGCTNVAGAILANGLPARLNWRLETEFELMRATDLSEQLE